MYGTDMFDFRNANNGQRKAIAAADGPVLITAGPGTGKTYTLVQRAIYLIEERGVKPESIFIATFTEKAAKELITRNSSPSAKGKARNLNFYTYSKGKVKKIWSTSDQAITYNKKQKTLVSLQSFGINEDKSAYSVYDIYKYNGKKIVKKGTYTFVRNTHFEDSHGNRPTYAEMESEDYNEKVHVVVDKETYTKKAKGKTETITKKQYNVATKGTVDVWAYNTATKSELIKKLNK